MGKKKQAPGFNSPFAAMAERLARAVEKPKVPAPPPRPVAPPTSVMASDDTLFAEEMAGVTRLGDDPRGRVHHGTPAFTGALPPSRHAADEAEAYAQLADLVEGSGPFSISDTDEYLEFLAPGIDRRLLKKLRRGDYALQGHVDLHGQTRDEARAAVERFIDRSRREGKRCVLIVHGRGLNSKDQLPVLKERVKAWLERGRLARQVLAFATARPCDGGAGALYVLLRR